MNAYNELKLRVYESGMNIEDIEDTIITMECCSDEELNDVCEAVEDMLSIFEESYITESRGNAVSRIQDIKARATAKTKADADNALINEEIGTLQDKIANLKSHIQKGRPGDASIIGDKIAEYQKQIINLRKQIGKNNQKVNVKSDYRKMQSDLTKSYARQDFSYADDAKERFVRNKSKDTKDAYYK